MKYIALYLFCAFMVLVLGISPSLNAQCDSIGWSSDPAVNLNVSPWGQNPHACTDGQGGVYILWNTNSFTTFQYLQHVDRCGIIQWAAPLEIRGEWNGTRFFPDLAEDEFGGALAAYTEWRVSGQQPWPSRVRVNRVDVNGNLLWGAYGVRVSLKDTSQFLPQVVPDGQGGAFVTYGVLDDSLFIQHISPTGERLWGDEGIFLGRTNLNFDHILISDEQGGIIVEWYMGPPTFNSGFKRLDNQENVLWTDTSSVFYNAIVPDGIGGAALGGVRVYSGLRDIVANHISPDGLFLWGNTGVLIEDSLGAYSKVNDIVLRADSVLVVYWMNVIDLQSDYQALIQMITPEGELFFPQGSIPPSIIPSSTRSAAGAILSNNNSTIFLFVDQSAVYAQKIDSAGGLVWDSSDVTFSYLPRQYVSNVSDKMGGLINFGSDEPLHGIFMHQISKNGNLGEVLDSISEIRIGAKIDIPQTFALSINYPNPFNSSTVIRYYLSSFSEVELKVYNGLGQEIKKLASNMFLPGHYEFKWEGIDENGQSVSSGVYYYRLKVNGRSETRKMVLIR